MHQEESLAMLNENIFLREFTFSASLFRDSRGQELELCDGAIWIDGLLILFQHKARNLDHVSADGTSESAWFKRKVSKESVRQFSLTKKYLDTESALPLANRRGQTVDFSKVRPSAVHMVTVYSPSATLEKGSDSKGRITNRVGFVHFIHERDYVSILATLHTPFELSEYLKFRYGCFAADKASFEEVSEKAVVGAYLEGPNPRPIAHFHETFVDSLVSDPAEFGMSRLFWLFHERMGSAEKSLEYHKILERLAMLPRNGLRVFRERINWAMESCKWQNAVRPCRFGMPQLDISFVFIPLNHELSDHWRTAIENFTIANQYEQKTKKAIGVTVSPDPSDPKMFLVNWLYREAEWEYDDLLESRLKSDSPFGTLRQEQIEMYDFNDNRG